MTKRPAVTILLISLFILSFPQNRRPVIDYNKVYRHAEGLFEKAGGLSDRADQDEKVQQQQDQLYRLALTEFNSILQPATDLRDDSLKLHLFIKMGLINHYFDSLPAAKDNYRNAIRLKTRLPGIQDSFLFKPYLFLGGILYDEHKFDSAAWCLQKAEGIQNSYAALLEESQRLYNKLGAMNYETGNYRLAQTYFAKALALLSPAQPAYQSLMVNYKMNIGSILVKLQDYIGAKNIYESLLPFGIYQNEIRHNLGLINNAIGKYREAINDLSQVNYRGNNKQVDLDYNFALAYENFNKPDSAEFYSERAVRDNNQLNAGRKNAPYGLVLKLWGDRNAKRKNYINALKYYQEAIIQFDIPFNETDIYKNPTTFTGIFSYINLFNTLTAKAGLFEEYYRVDKSIKSWEAALDAWESAFTLADYVEKTYESDESRLFLNQVKYSAHSKPIDLCLNLFDLTKEKKYLEKAYFFDQRNKASILSLNLQLPQLEKRPGEISTLIQKQSSLKSAITRMTLRLGQLNDPGQLRVANDEIRDLEIRLASVQQKLNNDPAYIELQPAGQIPSISKLQNSILDNNTALLSYHLSDADLVILVVTGKSFDYYRQPIGKEFYETINSYVTNLRQVDSDYRGNSLSKKLYSVLIKPVLSFISNRKRLLIIPDDELNYLPFEALKAADDRYLLESFSIQYQYSTALLHRRSENKTTYSGKTLAFAPFTDSAREGLDMLKYSKDEVESLDGKILTGENATRQNFLALANDYSVIHLATHASVNDSVPLRSYIAFYPAGPGTEFHLYAGEIYGLTLDSTELVILSACETGSGKLVRGEGLMSLSRAFAYAGCPNIITSLWKAEDKTTAFITKRLHYYLDKNYLKDEALRLAKLDLLNSDEIDPRFKTPNYWAHLVFIGEYEPKRSSISIWWELGGLFVLIAFAAFFILYKKRSRR